MNKNIKILIFSITIIASSNAMAGPFTPHSTDYSVQMLGNIFGANVGNIYLGGSPNVAFYGLIELLNVIILTIGTIIISYVGTISLVNTAQDGTPMGKKLNSIWLPMRSLVGMLLLVPGPVTGYSVAQSTVMWVILQGIGAANSVWFYLLDQLLIGNSAITETRVRGVDYGEAKALARDLFRTAVCMESYKYLQDIPAEDPFFDEANNDIEAGRGIYLDNLFNNPSTYNQISANVRYIYPKEKDFFVNTAITEKAYPTQPSDDMDEDQVAYTLEQNYHFGFNNDSTEAEDGKSYMCGKYPIKINISAKEFRGTSMAQGTRIVGGEEYPDVDLETLRSQGSTIFDAKKYAFMMMYSILENAAENLVNRTENESNLNFQISADIDRATQAYIDTVNAMTVPIQTTSQNDMEFAVNLGKQDGWIIAGSYYFILTKRSSHEQILWNSMYTKINPENNSIPTCTKSNIINSKNRYTCTFNNKQTEQDMLDLFDNGPYEFQKYKIMRFLTANYEKAQELVTKQFARSRISSSASFNVTSNETEFQEVLDVFIAQSKIMKSAYFEMLKLGWGEDLLEEHATFGFLMMRIGEIIIGAAVIAYAVIAIKVGGIDGMAAPLGVGAILSPRGLAQLYAHVVYPFLLFMAGSMWIFGASFAIYLPLIPYMIFTVTALGWVLLVIEAIIAAPIAALGLVTPGGDELGKLGPSLMLVTQITLKPTFMVVGFIIGAKLYTVINTLINVSILRVFTTLPESIFAFVAFIGLYNSFCISIANKVFSIIHVLPDQVLRWIGATTMSTDTQAVESARQGHEKSAKAGGDSMRSAANAPNKAAQKRSERLYEKGLMDDEGNVSSKADKDKDRNLGN